MRINVGLKHINGGVRGSSKCCPVALAISDILSSSNVTVGECSIYIDGNPFEMSYDIKNRIVKYDERGDMEPFSFEL